MNENQIDDMKHALRNGNRFYTDANDKDWNGLVNIGYATKHPGWDERSAYYRVTNEGKQALNETAH